MSYPKETQLNEVRGDWFKDHVATLTKHSDDLHELLWQKPGTGIFAITYILCGGTLMVHGDLGEAVYRWGGRSDRLSFPWLARCSLDYFQSKCCASELGREYIRFDPDLFRDGLAESIKDLGLKLDEDDLRLGLGDIGSEFEAREYLYRTIPQAESETVAALLSPGRVIDLRCASHLIGIQMAVHQFQSKAAA